MTFTPDPEQEAAANGPNWNRDSVTERARAWARAEKLAAANDDPFALLYPGRRRSVASLADKLLTPDKSQRDETRPLR